jgi:histone deacetylase 6
MIAALDAAKHCHNVLIVDWDVHCGDGSIEIMKQNRDIDNLMYFSIHRSDRGTFYPGQISISGEELDGRIIKVGFDGPNGDDFYIETFKSYAKRFREFKPDIILVSAGFDAARSDPLGGCFVTPKGYYDMTRILQDICPRIAMVLEGGYSLRAISKSALACVLALLGSELT